MERERRARVTGKSGAGELRQVQAYLPRNYVASLDDDDSIVIAGRDSAGWTLDEYVLPRLASGLIFATEFEVEQPTEERVDIVGGLMALDEGDLDEAETIRLFQHLVDTGLAWRLEGRYGRMAEALIEDGRVTKT
jgi:hypothetical protein